VGANGRRQRANVADADRREYFGACMQRGAGRTHVVDKHDDRPTHGGELASRGKRRYGERTMHIPTAL
jgi:hypothetical protein